MHPMRVSGTFRNTAQERSHLLVYTAQISQCANSALYIDNTDPQLHFGFVTMKKQPFELLNTFKCSSSSHDKIGCLTLAAVVCRSGLF